MPSVAEKTGWNPQERDFDRMMEPYYGLHETGQSRFFVEERLARAAMLVETEGRDMSDLIDSTVDRYPKVADEDLRRLSVLKAELTIDRARELTGDDSLLPGGSQETGMEEFGAVWGEAESLVDSEINAYFARLEEEGQITS